MRICVDGWQNIVALLCVATSTLHCSSPERPYASGSSGSGGASTGGMAGDMGTGGSLSGSGGTSAGGGGTSVDSGSSECPGLIGYWPADGDAKDHVGTNHGIADGVTYARGKKGEAFEFNGTSSVNSTTAPALSPTGSFTYAFWIKVASCAGDAGATAVDCYLVDRTSATNPLVDLKATGGKFDFQVRYDDNSGLGGPVGGTIEINAWTHIALIRDAGTHFYLYVNGQNIADSPDTRGDAANPALTPPAFKLGRHVNNPGFNGFIDEFKIHNNALNEAQIQSLATLQPCQ